MHTDWLIGYKHVTYNISAYHTYAMAWRTSVGGDEQPVQPRGKSS